MLLTADRVFNGQELLTNVTVEVADDKVVAIHSGILPQSTHYHGTLTAGFIDYHVNGGGGKLFNFTPELATLKTMVQAHAKFGTTAMLPTLITDSIDVMQAGAEAISEAIEQKCLGVLGVHFEGPHLAEIKKGVHPKSHIRTLGKAEKALFRRSDLGIKLVTLASEQVSKQDIKTIVEDGAKVSLGHSNASFDNAMSAVAVGVDGFTHLFNAMSPFTSREPGMVGAALAADNAWCGLILDGHHCHFSAAKVAYAAKPKGKLLLVTDAMSTIASEQTQFDLFGVQVQRNENKLTTPDGTLAGSALTMIKAVQNAVEQISIPLAEALNMASLYPAQYLQVDGITGSIEAGKQADLIVFNDDFDVTHTWIRGELVHRK